MIEEQTQLREKFWQLLRWEKVKRRERILISALSYSLLVSLITLPAGDLFPSWAGPLTLSLPLFLVMTLVFSIKSPWGSRESVRTIFRLDKSLRLQERAVTAWEILGRKERRPAELLVLAEAAANLRMIDIRALFKRQWSWHAFLAPPLLLLWVLIAWLDVDFHLDWLQGSRVVSVAQKLKDFSQGLMERAKEDKLTESLKTARALEEVAEKGLQEEIGEEKLKKELAAAVNRIGGPGSPVSQEGASWPHLSGDALSDLNAEVGKLKDAHSQAESLAGKGLQGFDTFKKLASLSPFSGEIGKYLLPDENLENREVAEYLDKLGKRIGDELDRRTLMETREFLRHLLNELEGREDEGSLQATIEDQRDMSSSSEKDSTRGTLPGDRPGSKEQKAQPPPFRARATTHLRGLFGKGLSAGLGVRGEFQGEQSEVPQEEIVTSYQRQVEGELASEQIPEEFKETIKKYFLSLGMAESKR